MCGLFGGISNVLTPSEIQSIEKLAVLSQFRGTDSTGIAVVYSKKKEKKVKWALHHELGNSSTFLEQKPVRELLRKPNISAVLGHTRYTTSGEVNIHNAHPIQEQHITGCHNGVLHDLEEKDDDPATMTDSRRLFQIIAKKGLQNAVNAADQGSMAITYLDKQAKTVNVFRNWARDLYLTSDALGTTWLWASEEEMLRFVIDRENMKGWKKPWLLPQFTLFTWYVGSTQYKETKIKQPSFSSVIHPVSYPGISGSTAYASCIIDPWAKQDEWDDEILSREEYDRRAPWDNYSKAYNDKCPECWGVLPVCYCKLGEPIEKKTKKQIYKFFGGGTVALDLATKWLKAGCFGCKKEHTLQDRVVWPHFDYYLCHDCSTLEFYKEYLKHVTTWEGRLLEE